MKKAQKDIQTRFTPGKMAKPGSCKKHLVLAPEMIELHLVEFLLQRIRKSDKLPRSKQFEAGPGIDNGENDFKQIEHDVPHHRISCPFQFWQCEARRKWSVPKNIEVQARSVDLARTAGDDP